MHIIKMLSTYITFSDNNPIIILSERININGSNEFMNLETLPWSTIKCKTGILLDIIYANNDLEWDLRSISEHEHITWEIFCNNQKLLRHCGYMTTNPNVTWEIICANPDKEWNYPSFSQNPNLTWDIVINNMHIEWSWYWIARHPNITPDIIRNNPNIPWQLNGIIENPNTICADIREEELDKSYWFWYYFLRHENTTWEIICKFSHKSLDWGSISRNPNITWEIICANPDKPWHWCILSSNVNITWDIIIANPDKPWRYSNISNNPNITCKIIRENPDKAWDWIQLSMNRFCNHPHFQSALYRQRVATERLRIYEEELIKVACHPRRMLQIDAYDSDHPLFGLTQMPELAR